MRQTQRTLGETKIANCAECGIEFAKKRFDARFCTKKCGRVWHNRNFWKNISPELRKTRNAERMTRYYRRPDVQARLAQPQQQPVSKKERKRQEQKRARQNFPWRSCLANAKNRADKKGFAFDLTREWCIANWTGYCAVTKIPFLLGTQSYFAFSPSIDRVDSAQGYTQNNCRFVLFAVNSLKGTGSDEDMLKIATAIVQNAAPPIFVIHAPDTDLAEMMS